MRTALCYFFQGIIFRGFATSVPFVKINLIKLTLFVEASLSHVSFRYFFGILRYVLTFSIGIFSSYQRTITCVFFTSSIQSELWSSRTSEPNISKYAIGLRLFILFPLKTEIGTFFALILLSAGFFQRLLIKLLRFFDRNVGGGLEHEPPDKLF